MSGDEIMLLVIGAAAGITVVLGGFLLIDRIREWRWRRWHR